LAVIENRILDFSVEHSRDYATDEMDDSLVGKPSGDIGEIRMQNYKKEAYMLRSSEDRIPHTPTISNENRPIKAQRNHYNSVIKIAEEQDSVSSSCKNTLRMNQKRDSSPASMPLIEAEQEQARHKADFSFKQGPSN